MDAPAVVRSSQLQGGALVYHDTAQLLAELSRNPILELVLGFALVEKLQDIGVLGDLQGNLIEGGIAAIVLAQQISPLVPALIQGGKSLSDVTGAVAGLAAGAAVGM